MALFASDVGTGVIPAKAGIQAEFAAPNGPRLPRLTTSVVVALPAAARIEWIPAFAGMTAGNRFRLSPA